MADIYQCKNCEETIDASFGYCPHCGQKTADVLTVGVLFSNTIKNYFSIDGRFFKSFIPLMTKPGMLARRFVDGKRQLYLHPAQYYLFISIVFFFVFSFTIRKADNEVSKVLEKSFNNQVSLDTLRAKMDSGSIEAIDTAITAGPRISGTSINFQKELLDSLILSGAPQSEKLLAMGKEEYSGGFVTKVYVQFLKLYEKKGNGIINTLYDTIPIAMFFLLPLFALLLKLFYWSRGTFAHHIVFSFYYFTFLFTIFCLLTLANTFIVVPDWVNVLVLLSLIIYLILALHHFYESNWKGAFFKASFISLMYMLFVLPVAVVGIVFVSFLLY